MLTILGWLWKNPNPDGPHYSPWHANVWARKIHQNLTIPHRFVLVTDTPEADFDPLITPIPLWDDCKDLKPNWSDKHVNCYRRLKAFSAAARDIIGERFASVDLDCVVLGNLDAIFDRPEDFVILKRFLRNGARPENWAQGSMWMMTAGCRSFVWDDFRGQESVGATWYIGPNGKPKWLVGTDQSWINYKLEPTEAGWTEKDGVTCWLDLNMNYNYEKPSSDLVKLIFFNTSPDQKPWVLGTPIRQGERAKVPWLGEYYRNG